MGGGSWRSGSRAVLAAALSMVLAACAGDAAGPLAPDAEFSRGKSKPAGDAGATVYVVHGINGRDLGAAEALPVDVVVNGVCAIQGFTFRQIAGPLALPAGSYDIEVRLADAATPCSGPVAISASGVSLAAKQNVSIVAHLTGGGAPTASVFANETNTREGRARLTARHTANFGAVDILVDGRTAFAGVINGQQGSAQLRPGRHSVAINVAGTSTTAWMATPDLRPFRTYIAYAVGTPANGTFEVILQAIAPSRDSDGDDDDDRDDDDRDD